MKRLLITRPQKDSEQLSVILDKLGVPSILQPMINVKFLRKTVPGFRNVQALLITSANGLRAFMMNSDRRDIAVFSVGRASAAEAKSAGFLEVQCADGDVDSLLELIRAQLFPNDGTLLHPASHEVAGDLGTTLKKLGFHYKRIILYESQETPSFENTTLDLFDGGGFWGAVFFSPRTATIFEKLIIQSGRESVIIGLDAFCLSNNIQRALCLNWKKLFVAKKPTQESLLETVKVSYSRLGQKKL